MSLVMSPTLLLGTVISIFTIGSSSAGLACWNTLRKAIEAGRLEGLLRAVHRMVLAEEDLDADVLHLVAGDHAPLQPVLKPFSTAGRKLLGIVPPTIESSQRKLFSAS